jgi:hypothetical protein
VVCPKTTHGTPFVVPVDFPEVFIPLLGVVAHDWALALAVIGRATKFLLSHRCVSIEHHTVWTMRLGARTCGER